MFEELLSGFLSSQHGQNALQALQQNGMSAEDAQRVLAEAVPAASQLMTAQTKDHPEPKVGLFNLFGGHAAKEFLIGLTEGIVRGDGIGGALEDGGISLLAGHLGEVIGERCGMDEALAGDAAAIAAPFIVRYVHERLA